MRGNAGYNVRGNGTFALRVLGFSDLARWASRYRLRKIRITAASLDNERLADLIRGRPARGHCCDDSVVTHTLASRTACCAFPAASINLASPASWMLSTTAHIVLVIERRRGLEARVGSAAPHPLCIRHSALVDRRRATASDGFSDELLSLHRSLDAWRPCQRT